MFSVCCVYLCRFWVGFDGWAVLGLGVLVLLVGLDCLVWVCCFGWFVCVGILFW